MDELDLELERDKQRPVEVVKKGGWLGKIVALLLGIILGFVGCFGAIAAVVYYFIGVMKIEEGAGYLKGVLGDDFDYTDYIAGEYGDKTTLDLILSTTTAAQSVLDGTGTLNTLNDIYPFLYTVVAGAEDADPNVAFNGIVPMLKQYGLELDAAVMMSLIVNGTGGEVLQPDKYLTDYVLDNAYDLAIGDLLQIVPFPASPIIDALFYGQEGVDYVVNADGLKEPVQGGTPWLTIEGLLFAEGDVIGERINAITLDAVISVPENNDIMKALAYGSSSHYEYVNGEAVMKQQTYTFDGTYLYDDNGEKVDGVVAPLANGIYSLTQDDKTLYLKADENGNYLAYTDQACTNAALYKKTTIGDLNGDTDSLINNIELGSTLNVTPSSNKVLLALAYGTEGEDYDVVNGEIKMRDGKKKRTIGDLTNGGDELIENIRLADVMETDTGDAIMMYLLYGKKDVHYKLDKLVDDEPISLQKQIAVLEHNDSKLPYNVYGDTRLDGTTDGATYTVDGITYYLSPVEDTTTTPATQMTVAIKDEDHTDVSGNAALYYVFEDEAKTIPVKFEPTTLGELMNDSSIISNLTNRLTLVEVMGETALDGTPMKNLGQYVINDVPKQIDTLTMQDIYDYDDVKDNKVLSYLYNAKDEETDELYPISNLKGAVDNMAIIDVLEINDNPILQSLAYEKDGETLVKVNEMSRRLDELTVGDVFGDDIYEQATEEDGTPKVDKNGNPVYKQTTDKDGKLVYVVKEDANPILVSLSGEKIIALDEKINTLTVSNVFDETEINSNPILKSLAYDEEGEPVLINDMSDRLNALTVGDVFGDDIYEQATEEDGTPKVDKNGNPVYKQTTDKDGKLVYVVKEGANPVLVHLKDTKVTEMAGEVDKMKVGYIFKDELYEKDESGNYVQVLGQDGKPVKDDNGYDVYVVKEGANPVLVHLRNTPVTKMADKVESMTLGDIFKDDIYKKKTDEDGKPIKDENGDYVYEQTTDQNGNLVYVVKEGANPVLAHLEGTKVTALATKIDSMTVGDIFKDEIYEEDGTIKDTANPILAALHDCPIDEMSTRVANLTVGQVFEDDIYDEDGNIKGTWYYLLKDPATGVPCPDYKLTSDMDTMMENMSANMKTASLKELNDNNIIDLSGNELLSDDKEIPYDFFSITPDQRYKDQNGEEKTRFNQLTVYELFDFVSKIISTKP